MANNWEQLYKEKLQSAEEAVGLIPDGSHIIQTIGFAEPPAILREINVGAKQNRWTELHMYSLLPLAATREYLLAEEVRDVIHWHSLYASAGDRDFLASGVADFIPNYFHQVPRLVSEFIQNDVCITTVSPMDQNGYMSFGVSVDYTSTAARVAKKTIVQVNENMPRVHGDSFIHVSEVDAIVEENSPIPELPTPARRDEDDAMGEIIAEMVPDGATIQLGIGGVPNAVAQSLKNHKDLGIHTEMFTDSMVDLIQGGVATGSNKTFHPGKALWAFAAGSRRMYDFLDDNPVIEARPVSYTNFPPNIARNNSLVSENSTIEVDFTGQCCSESIGTLQYSGTGGQHDFARGAFDSSGGKSIVAFYSTAKSGTLSRVVPVLKPGAVVTTPRMEVNYLVSEFGAAQLKGKSIPERTKAIIGLAHPQFRDELTHEAKQMGYL